ncbi:MAG: response regulator [Mariniblastus sp.]
MTNLLIVDDTDVDLMLMEGLLSAPGFTIVTAGDGFQALEKISEWSIDLILTDLQMPRMDGLELVREVRKKYPDIPVILTTGKGSEDIAEEALLAGASTYIPKSKLSGMLESTVKEVLDLLSTGSASDGLFDQSFGSRFQFELKPDSSLIPKLVSLCQQMLHTFTPLDRIDRLRIAIAVDQAVQNSYYRGNLEIPADHKIDLRDLSTIELIEERLADEKYSSRLVSVRFDINHRRFSIRIEDDGPGFDSSSAGSWDEPASRGTVLMHSFMDTVKYNQKGNVVKMRFVFDKSVVESEPVRDGTKVATLTCLSTEKVYPLDIPKLVIGSREGCHIKLKSDQVAALHCTVTLISNKWSLVVLTQRGVTKLNHSTVMSATLTAGDIVTIGDYEFAFDA